MTLFDKRYHPAGTPPGTLTKAQAIDAGPLRIRLIDFDRSELNTQDSATVAECQECLRRDTVTWVHVEGHPTESAMREFGEAFGLHSLALEDVLNTGQRPKVESYADHLFVIMNLPAMADGLVSIQQVSFFLGKNYLITFCEGDFAPFQPIVNRLRVAGGRVRERGADYLMYGILDLVIDRAFPLFESFGMQLEELEDQILETAGRETMSALHLIRRELIVLRRNLWPQREVINELLREDSGLIRQDTHVYLRDCYDHAIQAMDLLETYRDIVGSMLELYLSSVSNRMNDVMRVLTVIATIFIPLTFIAGVYGMNFDRSAGPWNMPELGHPLGYVFVWIAMLATGIGMILFFRSRKWF